MDKIISPVLMQEKQELAVANQNMTPDGRFRCRFPGCEKKNIQVSSSMSTLIPIILFLCRFSLMYRGLYLRYSP